ncbi:hypothetical protein QBC41DRAFT_301631 [Cercophora samala]|uniref:Uncharacterized protein n=1 Tax=Cercophora samala TaxID=330535 RepID=A0AA39ZG89_9PEZI|nr:hypothetical protein QBC41DRAFT_301631 [Cercophora samala]
MASPNSPTENGVSETKPVQNGNSSSSSSSPPSASVGENLAQPRGRTASQTEVLVTEVEAKEIGIHYGISPDLELGLEEHRSGEQTATALEKDLTKLESRLDEILASLGVNIDDLEEGVDSTNDGKESNGEVNGKK